jgi:hypothetical protein
MAFRDDGILPHHRTVYNDLNLHRHENLKSFSAIQSTVRLLRDLPWTAVRKFHGFCYDMDRALRELLVENGKT